MLKMSQKSENSMYFTAGHTHDTTASTHIPCPRFYNKKNIFIKKILFIIVTEEMVSSD